MNLSRWLKAKVAVVSLIGVVLLAVGTVEPDGASYAATGVTISDAGLDVTKRSGRLAFYQRIQDAVMLSCDPTGNTKVLPYFNRPEGGDCYSDTLLNVLTGYNDSKLMNIHVELQREPIIY